MSMASSVEEAFLKPCSTPLWNELDDDKNGYQCARGFSWTLQHASVE